MRTHDKSGNAFGQCRGCLNHRPLWWPFARERHNGRPAILCEACARRVWMSSYGFCNVWYWIQGNLADMRRRHNWTGRSATD